MEIESYFPSTYRRAEEVFHGVFQDRYSDARVLRPVPVPSGSVVPPRDPTWP